MLSSLGLADSALQLSDIDDISADTDDKAASTKSVYDNVGLLSAAISEKRNYFDLSYNTTHVVHGPAWELSYKSQQGVIDDTATLYVVESGSSGGYDYETWSGTSKKSNQVQLTLIGHSSGVHAGTWNWGTARGNIDSISLDTTEFSVGKLAGTKVSEYEVENKDYLALKSELDIELSMPTWYPNGSVKHPSEWTPIWNGSTGLKCEFYEQSHTAAVYPFAGSG